MPYIKKEDRDKFNIPTNHLPSHGGVDPLKRIGEVAECAGDLNFAITVILKHYLEQKGENYATHNEIMGMLESCKQEWYRRQVGPYENTKIDQNGDV